METTKTILIVDNDSNCRRETSDILKADGYKPIMADSGQESLELFSVRLPLVALINLKLDD